MDDHLTVVYITDNALNTSIASACKRHLLKAVVGKRLLTVSQKPMNFGENICMGDIGRSGLNIDLQIKAGLEKATTKFIAIAEHDCVYSKEHFDFVPPDEEFFYYNKNNWLLQNYNPNHPELDGMFSFVRRKVQSQLIASRDRMLEATNQKIAILSDPDVKNAWPGRTRLGEPGTDNVEHVYKVFRNAGILGIWPTVKKYVEAHESKFFTTEIPTIDIRHGDNFSGVRRGKKRRWELDPWGTMDDILNG